MNQMYCVDCKKQTDHVCCAENSYDHNGDCHFCKWSHKICACAHNYEDLQRNRKWTHIIDKATYKAHSDKFKVAIETITNIKLSNKDDTFHLYHIFSHSPDYKRSVNAISILEGSRKSDFELLVNQVSKKFKVEGILNARDFVIIAAKNAMR